MKLSGEFMLQEIAGKTCVLPLGEKSYEFRGVLQLNDTGKFLWEQLSEETAEASLAAALAEQYDCTPETARADVEKFLNILRSHRLLTE